MNIPSQLIPNGAQVAHAARWIMAIGGTLLAANGASNGVISNWESITGVVVTVTPLLWGMFVHTDAATVERASQVKGVAEPIKISPSAPSSLQDLANDRDVPTVQSVIPNYVSPTQRK